jgi:hypothetical protein
VPAAAEAVKRMREADQTLRSRWQHAMEIQLRAQNSRQRPQSYKVGDKVLLSSKNLRLPGPKKKMGPKFIGPFRIRDAVGS